MQRDEQIKEEQYIVYHDGEEVHILPYDPGGNVEEQIEKIAVEWGIPYPPKRKKITWKEKKKLAEYLGVSTEAVHQYNKKKLELMLLGLKALKGTPGSPERWEEDLQQ